MAENTIARVLGQERIANRPAPLVHLDSHPPFVAGDGAAAAVGVIQLVRLKQLQRQRGPATAEGLTHQPNEDLPGFRHGTDCHALDLLEAEPARHVAGLLPAPHGPASFDGVVDHLIQPAAAALHPNLHLQPDAGTDDLVLDRGDSPPGVVVIADQLPRSVPQSAEAALDLTVGAGATGDPVGCQARDAGARIGAALPWHHLHRCRCCQLVPLPLALRHQNLTNRLRGSPRPLAMRSAASSLATMPLR